MTRRIGVLLGLVMASTAWFAAPVSGAGGAPDTVITKGPSGTVAITSATFDFKSKPKKGATYQCRIDAGRWKRCTSPTTYPGLAQGVHEFAVRAKRNGLKDRSPATRSFVVDTLGPTVGIGGLGARTSDSTPTLTLTASEPSTLTCQLGEATPTSCVSPFTLPGPLAEGSYTLRVRGRDLAGNVGAVAVESFDIVNPVPRDAATMGVAASMWLPGSMAFDVAAVCSGTLRIDCPDGVTPIPPTDQVLVDSVRSLAADPADPDHFVLTASADVTTAVGAPIKLTFVQGGTSTTCDLTYDSSRGIVDGWTLDADLGFIDVETETGVNHGGTAVSGAEPQDVHFDGAGGCGNLDDIFPERTTNAQDQVAQLLADHVAQVGNPLCAAVGPAFLGTCP